MNLEQFENAPYPYLTAEQDIRCYHCKKIIKIGSLYFWLKGIGSICKKCANFK